MQYIANIVQIEVQIVGWVRDLAYHVPWQHLLQDLARRHLTHRKSECAVTEVYNVYPSVEIFLQSEHFWWDLGWKHARYSDLEEHKHQTRDR